MSIKDARNQLLFSIIILLISFKSITYQIKVPIKLIKTTFQKVIAKKISSNDDSSTQSISDPLNHLDNYLFAIDFNIGSNNQKFTILLDTGSEIFWIPGSESSSSKTKYNPSNSQTSSKSSEEMIYSYSSGTISGYYYNDQINFLSSTKYNAYFGVASNIGIDYYFFDGIMGLARKYSDTKKSILHTLKNIGAISSTKFSFKYDYNSNQANIYVDEIHNDFQSSDGSKTIASCPLINSAYYGKKLWVCNIVSLGIKQGDDIIKKLVFNIEGLFDTGTNNVVFPSKYIEGLQSTLSNLNCYLYEEGNSNVGSEKAIYCRNKDNLPKITIGLPKYILTLGKSNFYNKIYINNEYVYRLRFLFVENVDFCVIGQNFFYEYHTLFDDDSGFLKFYNDDDSKVVYHVEDVSTGTSTWIIVFIIVGSILIVAGIVAIILICCCCWRKPQPNIVLKKELLEMSSIQKAEDEDEDDDNEEKTFNQIMSITSDKKYKGIKINVHTKPK
jgi:hypothetical protein